MLNPVFGNAVDYGLIDINSGAGIDPRTYEPIATNNAVTLENSIYFPSDGYQSDFSTANLQSQAWLVHEVGHIYQYKNNPDYSWVEAVAEGLRSDTYKYSLNPGMSFDDYRYEQQARILQDYYIAMKRNSSSLGQFQKILNPKGFGMCAK
ncbi:hypothetical protein [Methylomonas sp. DH-1]|uniref:hypothetical protein n=1 Tax=Methylomonas sp. (strain DH-1) TaxID=1727196 RepID=UPI000A406C1A|nr:hypothetical protein [Methylomonas sp. DH-1]